MEVTLITPGGGRPQAFALCEKYMQRQTIWGTTEIQWIVADDNEKDPVECTLGQTHIFGNLKWTPNINTLRYNLDAAIPLIKGEYVFIIENDDLYKPRYLEVMLQFLQHADLVGYCDVTYYNISRKSYFEMGNFKHASLCCTAFVKTYIPYFYRAIHSGEAYADTVLWQNARRARHKCILFSGMDNLSLGMKGLPGRTGIGVGHTSHEFIADQQWVKLRSLMPEEDAKVYIDMVK